MTEQPHILAVEDEEISLQFLVYHLEKAGFRVSTASSGTKMKERLANEDVDLILLDLGLPDGDGLSLAREIRATSAIPIVVLTARQSADDKLIALGLGTDDYLIKPCDPRELLLRIRNVLVRGNIPCAPEPVPAHEMPASPPMTKPAEKPRRSGPALLLALMLGLGLAGGVGGAAWWYMSQTELKLAEDIDDADATEDADSAESPMPMRADAPTGAPVGTPADIPSPAPPPAPTPPNCKKPNQAPPSAHLRSP